LVATNTIGQGDTRETGLYAIIAAGGAIIRATRRLKWPGEAAVVVSVVHIVQGRAVTCILDSRSVKRISAFLVNGGIDKSPVSLSPNQDRAFEGSKIYGSGFTFDDDEAKKGNSETITRMRELIAHNLRNRDRIFPYIGGEELNGSAVHAHDRFVIDFQDMPLRRDPDLPSWKSAQDRQRTQWLRDGVVPADYEFPVAADWPDLLEIVERRVKPERAKIKREARRKRWWRFGDRQPGLY
jgi:hypothetical protein